MTPLGEYSQNVVVMAINETISEANSETINETISEANKANEKPVHAWVGCYWRIESRAG